MTSTLDSVGQGQATACITRPIREELYGMGLLAQQAPPDAAAQPAAKQPVWLEEMRDAGKVGARGAACMRAPDAQCASLSQWVVMLLCLSWLLWTRRDHLTWVASRAYSWASTGTQPTLTAIAIAYLA